MAFIVFLYGIVFGSFLNVCIYRIPRGESIAKDFSHCTNCNHRLKWIDLVPIFSYLFLKGKCRYCGDRISLRYPMVECLTGILVTGLYLRYGISYEFARFSVLTLFLIVIALIDYDTTDVYSSVIYTGIALGIIFIIIEEITGSCSVGNYFAGAMIGLGVIGAIYLFTGGMGAGDIEIAVLCGVFLGWKLEIYFILASFIIGGTIAVILILLKKKRKDEYIPLGPALALGAYTVMILGETVIFRISGIG